MISVLVIGCGNIGAQYDMYSNEILTHVKAWSLLPEVTLTVADLDDIALNKVAELYKCRIITNWQLEALSSFDCVSICTPTFTHREILERCFFEGVKTVICEKPISVNEEDIQFLKKKYSIANTKVLVNFIRRFQPEFRNIKKLIYEENLTASLTNISIRYQRGFINNCSHAFDLIEFLFDQEVRLEDIKTYNEVFDQFEDDPTLSLMANWNGVNFTVLGISNILFSNFEIDFYFRSYKICILNGGQNIAVYRKEILDDKLGHLLSTPIRIKENCLKDYMKHVIDYTMDMIQNKEIMDNFIAAADLNQRMLKYLKKS